MTQDQVATKTAEVTAHGASSWPEFWAYLGRQSLMELLLVFVLGFACFYLWRIQKASNNIDLIKLILTNGEPDYIKFCVMGAFVIGSWCIIHLAVAGTWSDQAFLSYIGAFALTAMTQAVANRPQKT